MMKEALRADMRAKRRLLSDDDIIKCSKSICDKLFTLKPVKSAGTVCVFLSAFKEPDTSRILDRLFANKKRVAVPVSDKETVTLSLSYIDGKSSLIRGAYNIYEPSVIKAADLKEVDAILVPGLAFDRRGGRMGFGKGYYDKLLEGSGCTKIGICYDFQLFDEIPMKPHDVMMDFVVTEKEIVEVK